MPERTEATEQAAVVEYCDIKHIPVFHIPNEGKRSYAEGANMRRKGLKKGVPDLFIPVPSNGFHGLFIELKYGKGKPSNEQAGWLSLLSSNGYMAAVCYGFDEAVRIIESYLKKERG